MDATDPAEPTEPSLLTFCRSHPEVFTEPFTEKEEQTVRWVSYAILNDQPMTVWFQFRSSATAVAAAALLWARERGTAEGLCIVDGAGSGNGGTLVIFRRNDRTYVNSKVRGHTSLAYDAMAGVQHVEGI